MTVKGSNPKQIQGVNDLDGKGVRAAKGSNSAAAAEAARAELQFYPGIAQAIQTILQPQEGAIAIETPHLVDGSIGYGHARRIKAGSLKYK